MTKHFPHHIQTACFVPPRLGPPGGAETTEPLQELMLLRRVCRRKGGGPLRPVPCSLEAACTCGPRGCLPPLPACGPPWELAPSLGTALPGKRPHASPALHLPIHPPAPFEGGGFQAGPWETREPSESPGPALPSQLPSPGVAGPPGHVEFL